MALSLFFAGLRVMLFPPNRPIVDRGAQNNRQEGRSRPIFGEFPAAPSALVAAAGIARYH